MKKSILHLIAVCAMYPGYAQYNESFENYTLAPNSAYSNTNSVPFQSQDALFRHQWDNSFGGFWAGGFAYTDIYDSTTAGFNNLYGVKAYKGRSGSSKFCIGQDMGIIKIK